MRSGLGHDVSCSTGGAVSLNPSRSAPTAPPRAGLRRHLRGPGWRVQRVPRVVADDARVDRRRARHPVTAAAAPGADRSQRGGDQPRAPGPQRRAARCSATRSGSCSASRACRCSPPPAPVTSWMSSPSGAAPTFAWDIVADGDERQVGDLRIRFVRTDHPVETLAVRIDHPSGSLAYSADTGERAGRRPPRPRRHRGGPPRGRGLDGRRPRGRRPAPVGPSGGAPGDGGRGQEGARHPRGARHRARGAPCRGRRRPGRRAGAGPRSSPPPTTRPPGSDTGGPARVHRRGISARGHPGAPPGPRRSALRPPGSRRRSRACAACPRARRR